ncbi:zincin-like metallopeptidase domain-containing protein [Litchfieldella rifensis]|uniref:Zincin-like metallopeptidase domain-containing protein n=1 Tax=Litchfieldella rifensis TaxID=762643 RepID=A0ABV7LIW9_9GAMM
MMRASLSLTRRAGPRSSTSPSSRVSTSSTSPSARAIFDLVDEAERLIEAIGARIDHVEGDKAFYSPILDRIQLPAKHQFR